jgi:hypothetical protein
MILVQFKQKINFYLEYKTPLLSERMAVDNFISLKNFKMKKVLIPIAIFLLKN